MRFRRLLVSGAFLGAIAVTGCGGSDGGGADPKLANPDTPKLQKQTPSTGGSPASGAGQQGAPTKTKPGSD
jgi:hypothetical protein